MTILTLKHISKSFGKKILFKDISYEFEQGTIYRIVGENGTGKSTLLKIMMGLMLPDEGVVELNGESSEKFSSNYRKQINYAFSSDRTLYYKLNAYENLYYIGRIYGIPRKELGHKVVHLLEKVGLAENSDYVENYSTGMKKKLLIAKSFLNQPKIIFYDEVFNGLDKDSCEAVIHWISKEKDITFIIISHQETVNFENEKILKIEGGKLREI
nr:ABC transporter ATP-binding protein [Roseburia sp.]